MRQWWARWQARREAAVLARRAIPDALWQLTLTRLPFLAQRSADDLAGLRRLSSLFLDQKEFSAAGDLAMSDDIAVAIAAQACLPVLHLAAGLTAYAGFVGIVVHPDGVVTRREHTDEFGIVHSGEEELLGEAQDGGPMMLSWRHVAAGSDVDPWVCNVVIHEFAHVLDLGDGLIDGIPPLPSADERAAWHTVLSTSYRRFCRRVDARRPSVIDPYASSSEDEYFAVVAEVFFVQPKALRAEHPAMYRMLARYFGQDPAAYADAAADTTPAARPEA